MSSYTHNTGVKQLNLLNLILQNCICRHIRFLFSTFSLLNVKWMAGLSVSVAWENVISMLWEYFQFSFILIFTTSLNSLPDIFIFPSSGPVDPGLQMQLTEVLLKFIYIQTYLSVDFVTFLLILNFVKLLRHLTTHIILNTC